MSTVRSMLAKNFWGIRPFKRHSLVLMVGGIFYVSTGVTYAVTPLSEARKQALGIALDYAPMQFWGAIFVMSGLMAFVSSRWPPVSTSWGYMALAGLSAGWAATYAAGVILGDAPSGNLTGTFNWGLLAFLWWALPGFVNPDKTVVVVINDRGREDLH